MSRVKIELHIAADKKAKAEKILVANKLLGLKPKTKIKRVNTLKVARSVRLTTVESAINDVDRMINENELTGKNMSYEHFIGLYCWIVEAITDISVADYVAKTWGKLDLVVRGCCKNKFGGNKQIMLEYMQWFAKDLQRLATWKKSKSIPVTIIPWYKFFCDENKFLDFQIHRSRIEGFVG